MPYAMDQPTTAGWVLLAVAYAGGRSHDAPLDMVIAAADVINHAVIVREELELAVQILEGAGLVEAGDTSFRLTDLGYAEVEAADKRTWMDTWDVLTAGLARLGVDARSVWRVDPEAFDAAVASYLDRHH